MPDCSVIIVSYNTRALTLRCIGSVRASAGPRVEVVVVDNASTDGSADAIAGTYPDVVLFRNADNVGFARAVNRGLGLAHGRTLLLLNPDAAVEPDTIARLVEVLDGVPGLGAVGPLVVSPAGEPDPHCAARDLSVGGQLAWHLRLTGLSPELYLGAPCGPHGARLTERISGAALAFRRDVLERVGPLDERFFLYFEDADWLRRVRAAGYQVACVTGARAVHAQGSSSRQDPLARSRHALASELAFFAKHDGPRAALILRLGIAGNALLRAVTIDAVRALRPAERYRIVADLQTLRRCVMP